ncbi:hypothetical protein HZS_3719 [Henneguya salminicola]|nr:hypothetical protein HZS_3719 [Henneguya salminicola]
MSKRSSIGKDDNDDSKRNNSSSDDYWEIGKKRRVTISNFGHRQLVDIREYYEDDSGVMKPGRKGISLTAEQFKQLCKIIPEITEKLG